ncbi:MAG: DinB family protein [Candidatus Sulfotelmatobacter sp.]
MSTLHDTHSRRKFLKASAVLTTGLSGFGLLPQVAWSSDEEINIIGPKAGYSPQIGTLVSMMTWMRSGVLRSVKGLSQKDLDYLLDSKANSIGALLLHLAATETYYQMNTLDAKPWGSWPDSVKQKWDTPMELGEPARKAIKGHDVEYYLKILEETREKSLAEFRKRDDSWLMSVDKQWPWGPTNNYCKWFHVCEHESNHNGQIKLLAKRLPGAKAGSE